MTTTDFSGTTTLVTGATRGIGRATANYFAEHGSFVLVGGRDEVSGLEVVQEIRSRGGSAEFVPGDLRNAPSVREFAQRALEEGKGRIDILINNAGIFPFINTVGASEDDFDTIYAINVRAPFLLVGELAPQMVARGNGAIVNVLTMRANFGMPGMALYGSTKAALSLLTMAWASEFGRSGVRVNAVSPGPTLTEGTAAIGEPFNELGAAAPAGRVASPTEIAATIAFLASENASFIHGTIVDVDGGRSAT
jgi:NAD(P)-dependent dehydrogenase (short-subunit alcohol dehydrogenase family)